VRIRRSERPPDVVEGRRETSTSRHERSRVAARLPPALSRPGALRDTGRAESAAPGGRGPAPARLGRPALVPPRLRLDGRNRLRRAGRGARRGPNPTSAGASRTTRCSAASTRAGSCSPASCGRATPGRPPETWPSSARAWPAGPAAAGGPSSSGRSRVRCRCAVRPVRATWRALRDQATRHRRSGQPHRGARGVGALARGGR